MLHTRRRKLLAGLLLVALSVVFVVILLPHLIPDAPTRSPHPFFVAVSPSPRRPLAMAHRGGALLRPENTLAAFTHAAELGTDVLETDVRRTIDDKLILLHDASVARTTDGEGAVAALSLEEVKRLDAGYRFTTDGGRTFPFRNQEIRIPTLAETFDLLPRARFNIEIKDGDARTGTALCRFINERAAWDRVVVAAVSQSVIVSFRRECPRVATAASSTEASEFMSLNFANLAQTVQPAANVLQVPERFAGLRVLNADFIRAAHERGLQVHAWTINDQTDMRRLIDAGIDGIITDRPDILLSLIAERSQTKP